MQESHVGLSEFYKQWLMALAEIQKLKDNPFIAPLNESLMTRLSSLRGSRAFSMALYLDPRFNFLGSTLFTPNEKCDIQVFLTANRVKFSKFHAQVIFRNTLSTYGKE